MKYKVGDRVKVQSLERYNKYKNKYGDINYGCETEILFTSDMSSFCGQVVTITRVRYIGCVRFYHVAEDKGAHLWVGGMFEGLVEEDVDLIPKFGEYSDNELLDVPTMTTDFVKEHGLPCPEGYIFKDENGNVINATKIVLEKKKKEYPKTYKECCRIIGFCSDVLRWDNPFCINRNTLPYIKHLDKLMESICKLLVCRDAYWKLYGEEMGLGKPWELSIGTSFYYIYYNRTLDTTKKDYADDIHGNVILAFPTKEMRDAFKENFKKEIEFCKELL